MPSLILPPPGTLRAACSARLLLSVAGAASFVWFTGDALPPRVASHFGPSGAANAFMPHTAYLVLTLALVITVPLLTALLPGQLLARPGARLNLPNADYWMAAQRREDTLGFLRRHTERLGLMLVGFLAWVHALVLRANALTPPHLSLPWLASGLIALAAFMAVWGLILFRRFRAAP